MIFVIDIGPPGGDVHTGIVEKVEEDYIVAIEGNSNSGNSREGVGVFRRKRRIASIDGGFIWLGKDS